MYLSLQDSNTTYHCIVPYIEVTSGYREYSHKRKPTGYSSLQQPLLTIALYPITMCSSSLLSHRLDAVPDEAANFGVWQTENRPGLMAAGR